MDVNTLATLLGAYAAVIVDNTVGLLFKPGHFLSLAPLGGALLLAMTVLTWRRRVRRKHSTLANLRKLIRVLFPRSIFLHRSAKADYAIVFINNGPLFFLTFTVLATPKLITDSLIATAEQFGIQVATSSAGLVEQTLFTIAMVLAWDFSATLAHLLKHKIPVLWEFHKVHHSAEVLTPVTALRRHPVDALVGSVLVTLSLGGAAALWHLVMGRGVEPLTIFGSFAGIYLWRLLGYNLRHSHIWISYGDFWNRVFISPAQHQVHHSIDPKHYDTNFGHIFSFWDRLFGTLYLPRHNERVTFGIEAHEMEELKTLRDLYLKPFIKMGARLVNAEIGRAHV